MSNIILDMMNKSKEKITLQNHPVSTQSSELRLNYLNGITLVMNIDDEAHKLELAYLIGLIAALGYEDSMVRQLLDYSATCDQEAIDDLTKSISQNHDVAINFMVDAVIISHKDNIINESETSLIKMYYDAFSITPEEKTSIDNIVNIILNKDTESATYFYMMNKHAQFNYLFDHIGFNGEIAISNLRSTVFKTEWISWEFSYGAIEKGFSVSKTSVTVEQFTTFLNFIWRNELLKNGKTKNIYVLSAQIVIDLSKSQIKYSDKTKSFIYDDSDRYLGVTGFTPYSITEYTKWCNKYIEQNNEVDQLTLKGSNSSDDIMMTASCLGKTSVPEVFWHKSLKGYRYITKNNFGGNDNRYTRDAFVDEYSCNSSFNFRIMGKSSVSKSTSILAPEEEDIY